MFNHVSYKFNPQADNALETIEDNIEDYKNKIPTEWQNTLNRLYNRPEQILETTRHFEKNQHEFNFLNLGHHNGTIFISHSYAPLTNTVREVESYIPRDQQTTGNDIVEEDRVLRATVG